MPAVAARGCGTRVKKGIYAEGASSGTGQPDEFFIIDQPCPQSPELELPAIGVKLVQDPIDASTWHVFDHVGSSHYPSVQDFVEEVARQGLSRRLPKTLDFAKLTEKSMLVMFHSRAIIENRQEVFGASVPNCPKENLSPERLGFGARPQPDDPTRLIIARIPKGGPVHQEPGEMCAGHWNWDVDSLDTSTGPIDGCGMGNWKGVPGIAGIRHMPAFEYTGYKLNPDVKRVYVAGAVMIHKLGRIVVIDDPDDPVGTQEAVTTANASYVPVDKEDE